MTNSEFKKDLLTQLQDSDFAAEYLSAMLEEDDPAGMLAALRDVLQANELSIAEVARRTHRHEKALHRVLSRKGNPQLDTLNAVLHAAGYRLAIVPNR